MRSVLHSFRDAVIGRIAPLTRASGTGRDDTILIIQPDHIGDILLSQPAVQQIRLNYPDKRVVGMVGPWSEAIARRAWDVDQLLTFPFPGFDRSRSSDNPLDPYLMLAEAADLARSVEPGKVFILRPDDWWSAWLASMATTGPVIAAHDSRMDLFSTVQVAMTTYEHAAQRALAIATAPHQINAAPGQFPLWLPTEESARIRAQARLHDAGIEGAFVVIHPGAGADVKTWPGRRWRAVVERLAAAGHNVVITGSPDEREAAEAIASGLGRTVCLAGETGLDELIEVLRLAALVAGPDSGPLHLAVACKTPSVHVFGPSDPGKFGPWGTPDRHTVVSAGWSCASCGDLSPSRDAGCGCMLAIDVHQVMQAIEEMLDRHAAE